VTRRAALVRHPAALAGIVLTTISAAVFLALAGAMAAGMLRNPYAGLVVFIALPAVFLIGLLLIPFGMWLEHRQLARASGGEAEWPVVGLGRPRVRRTVMAVLALSAVNISILLVAGYGALHWMESPQFCGQACHTPMHPQFSAWSASSHAQVVCAACHIGAGAQSIAHAKFAGVRQLWHVTTNSYPRPVPAVAAGMPFASDVCGRCHTATRNHGILARTLREYADDEANTESTTTLQMHVGGPGRPTASGRSIHWHANQGIRVEYLATDADRQTIPYVKVTYGGGTVKEFTSDGTTPEQLASAQRRVMDCVDCHNAVGHRVAPTVESAVNAAIAEGQIGRQLRFIRREAVRILSVEYPTDAAAADAIDRELRAFYRSGAGGPLNVAALEQAVGALRAVYRHNVFPAMKVTWGTYPDNIGHVTSSGCFRCHDGRTSKDGSSIGADCEYCHTQVQ